MEIDAWLSARRAEVAWHDANHAGRPYEVPRDQFVALLDVVEATRYAYRPSVKYEPLPGCRCPACVGAAIATALDRLATVTERSTET